MTKLVLLVHLDILCDGSTMGGRYCGTSAIALWPNIPASPQFTEVEPGLMCANELLGIHLENSEAQQETRLCISASVWDTVNSHVETVAT